MDNYKSEILHYQYTQGENFNFEIKYPIVYGMYEKHEELKNLFIETIVPNTVNKLSKLTEKNKIKEHGNTKVENVFTENYFNYNVFLLSENSLMKDFLNFVIRGFKLYLSLINYDVDTEFGMQSWLNMLSQHDYISRHNHQNFLKPGSSMIMVSSHYDLDVPVDYKTSTIYYNPLSSIKNLENNLYLEMLDESEYIVNQNENGKITFFPSVIDHQTSIVKTKNIRYTIAMDYIPYYYMQNSIREILRPIIKI